MSCSINVIRYILNIFSLLILFGLYLKLNWNSCIGFQSTLFCGEVQFKSSVSSSDFVCWRNFTLGLQFHKGFSKEYWKTTTTIRVTSFPKDSNIGREIKSYKSKNNKILTLLMSRSTITDFFRLLR